MRVLESVQNAPTITIGTIETRMWTVAMLRAKRLPTLLAPGIYKGKSITSEDNCIPTIGSRDSWRKPSPFGLDNGAGGEKQWKLLSAKVGTAFFSLSIASPSRRKEVAPSAPALKLSRRVG
ncbi:hypothetical protein KM043_000827 [Ampulex compressa]|nr:hypothetical protein KM043_000827 [Ampulex compressa]